MYPCMYMHVPVPTCACMSTCMSPGFHLLGGAGGKLPPQTLQLPPQKVLTINTISNNKNSGFMFFRALVIDTQKWAQKLCMLHTQLIFAHNPKQKILDETLVPIHMYICGLHTHVWQSQVENEFHCKWTSYISRMLY